MNCDVIINIDGKQHVIGKITGSGSPIIEIQNMLKNKSVSELKSLLELFPTYTDAANIKIDDIKENSVGLHSPAELINTLKVKGVQNLLIGLNIPSDVLKSKIIISGFGGHDVKTGYYNGHIFLNLDYMYDDYNKVIALVQLALYDSSPKDYELNSKILFEGSEEEKSVLIETLVKSDFPKKAELIDKIKFTYREIALKRSVDISTINDNVNKQDNYLEVNKLYREAMDVDSGNRDLNYSAAETINIKDVKQGDLIAIPYGKQMSYELFQDYSIDIEGNLIVKTITNQAVVNTRKTLMKKDLVRVRKFQNPVKVTKATGLDFKSVKTTFYTKINTGNLLSLIKNGKVEARLSKDGTYKEITEVRGNMVIIGGSAVKIKDLMDLKIGTVPTNDFKTYTYDQIDTDIWQPNQLGVSDGDHVLMLLKKDDDFLTEAVILAHGTITDKKTKSTSQIVFYATKGGKTSYAYKNSVKFVTSPQLVHGLTPKEELNVKESLDRIFDLNDLDSNNLHQFIHPKKGAFEKMPYSIQELNEDMPIYKGDYLYEKFNKGILKVVDVTNDYIKTVKIINGINRYIDIAIDSIKLGRYLHLSNSSLNKSYALTNILKNRYTIGNKPNLKDCISKEIKVFKSKTGYIYVSEKSEDTDITEDYKVILTERFKWDSIPESLYMYESINGGILKDPVNTVKVSVDNSTWGQIFEHLIPGMNITFKTNAKSFTVEKVLGDKVLLSYYHYTKVENQNELDQGLRYVRAEKFFVPKNLPDSVEVAQIYIPVWAETTYKAIKEIVPKTPLVNKVKASYATVYSKSDNPEIISAMIDLVQNKYGVQINVITNDDLSQFKEMGISKAAAFVYEGGIYVNIDKASIEEPLHEVLHLVLATMKSNNPTMYYDVVNSVQYHPLFKQVSDIYSDEINTEKLEETFVKLLSQTVRKNILTDEMFTEASFDKAIKDSISDLLKLNMSLDLTNGIDLLSRPVESVMTDFASLLIENPENLINDIDAFSMFEISGKIKELLKNDQLIQDCSY